MTGRAAATAGRPLRAALAALAAALAPSRAASRPPPLPAELELLGSPGAWLGWTEAGATALASANVGSGPYIAPAFRADTVTTNPVGTFSAMRGTYIRDAARQRSRTEQCSTQDIFKPGQLFCLDQLSVNYTGMAPGYNMNMTVGRGSDAVCKVAPSPYSDIFAVLRMAVHRGSSSVAGEPCELWAASLHVPGYSLNVSACIAADGVPRQFNQTSDMAYKAMANQFMTFSNVSVGAQPDEAFRPSEACQERWPTPPCPADAVEQLMLYRVGGATEPTQLENRNVGDALGDMAFFCALGGFDETKVVTSWSVQANSSWGQYAYCIYGGGRNTCFSGTGRQVGRESALGLGEGAVQGQCSGNADVGSWFSIPEEGRCPDGAAVGYRGCTWSARPLRRVSARCILEDRGLRASCDAERGHAPMLRSAAIFRAALETADPSKGGCPDVGETFIVV